MPKPLFDHFKFLATFYEKVIHKPDISGLLEVLSLQAGQKVLDVGGGTGRVAQLLSFTDLRLYIVDPSLGMLEQARAKKCCSLAQGLSEHLPFADGVFDRIFIVDSFHHFWNQSLAARELVRVLHSRGRMVIEELDIRRLSVRMIAGLEQIALMRSHFYSPQALAELFAGAGAGVRVVEKGVNYWVIVSNDR